MRSVGINDQIFEVGSSDIGLSTQIHMAVQGLGLLARFRNTAGQKGEAPQAAGGILLLKTQAIPPRPVSKRPPEITVPSSPSQQSSMDAINIHTI
jgi:hypothetical protein